MDAIHALDGSPAIDIKCFIPDKELFDQRIRRNPH